jgi:hypothetical protein
MPQRDNGRHPYRPRSPLLTDEMRMIVALSIKIVARTEMRTAADQLTHLDLLLKAE